MFFDLRASVDGWTFAVKSRTRKYIFFKCWTSLFEYKIILKKENWSSKMWLNYQRQWWLLTFRGIAKKSKILLIVTTSIDVTSKWTIREEVKYRKHHVAALYAWSCTNISFLLSMQIRAPVAGCRAYIVPVPRDRNASHKTTIIKGHKSIL